MFSAEYGYSLQIETSKEDARTDGWESGLAMTR